MVENLEDSPMAMLQLLNDLKRSGFDAAFSLHDGLEITIRKRGPKVVPELREKASSDLSDVKRFGNFRLKCGHTGRVVWVSHDGKTIAIRGVSRSCSVCGKRSVGSWTPNVYLISVDEGEEDD